MRVIGGAFRSRRLKSIPGTATRPTPDRLRETLFDILSPRIQDAVFLDAYAGTGAVGIEALSRGARHVFFLERSRAALEVIRENLAALSVEAHATLVTDPVLLAIGRYPADIVFADPPYNREREYRALLEALGASAPLLSIIQHSIHLELPETKGKIARVRLVRQGDNALSFFSSVP
jgi:16S rRNA (guanine966-N2)-methyltransferase